MTIPSNLPAVVEVTPPDLHNLCNCTATFAEPVSADGQAAIIRAAEGFHATTPGGDLRPHLFISFPNGTTMHVCHRVNKEMPTGELIVDLLQYLKDVLAISFPELPEPTTRRIFANTSVNQTNTPFVRRGGYVGRRT